MKPPPSVDILNNEEIRIVKVRQPWATFLVKGIKDVENRSWCLHNSSDLFPAWVLIASSKSKPDKSMMEDLRDRLHKCVPGGHRMALRFDTDRDDYEFGAILGLVKIDRCYDPKTHPITDAPSSVWYNKGDVAWIMTQAHEFDTPIKLDANDKMQTQVRLANRPQYKKKLADAIRDLRDDYDQELLMLPSKTLVFTQKSKRARVQKRALS